MFNAQKAYLQDFNSPSHQLGRSRGEVVNAVYINEKGSRFDLPP